MQIFAIPKESHFDKPAIIVELKCDKSAVGAITQIGNGHYVSALKAYKDNLLLVGGNYDKETKVHARVLEKVNI